MGESSDEICYNSYGSSLGISRYWFYLTLEKISVRNKEIGNELCVIKIQRQAFCWLCHLPAYIIKLNKQVNIIQKTSLLPTKCNSAIVFWDIPLVINFSFFI